MRYLIIALALLLGQALPAQAQLSLDIGGRGFNIGINMPVYPRLVLIPGYPVYYDPDVNSNYFFYDGLYWVYAADNWYASTWYNGPWELVPPEDVSQFLLLVPVRYYRAPPIYFRSWAYDRAPRWGEHWGRSWEQRRAGWDRWDRRSMPAAAPLPIYQRQYSGSRYPRAIEQQQTIQSQNYRYQPRDAVAQQHFRQGAVQGQAPTNAGRTRVQAPAGQQASPPVDQRRVQVDRQRQQTLQRQQAQQQQQQQQQSTQVPTPRMRQERPAQSAVQNQRIQNVPQDRGQVNAGPQGRGVETRSAPRGTPAAVQGPQAGGGEHRGQQEAKGGPQGKGEKGAREGKVKEDKKD